MLALLLPLCGVALVACLNALTFGRLKSAKPSHLPRVSVLVPARNEAQTIAATVAALLAQDYPDFELLVLDDSSSDGTAEIASRAGQGEPRLKVLAGAPLPAGWLGKPWACQQLARQATGDLLIFTDADVHWQPEALSALVAAFEESGADALTIWPTQQLGSVAERLVVPLMNFAVFAYLPEWGVRNLPWASLAAANGQCVAFRRETYAAINGHAGVAQAVVEDVALARRVKQCGRKLVMLLADGMLQTRMYDSWGGVRQGFGKNILAGHGGQAWALILSAVMHIFLFISPLGLALLGGRWALVGLAALALGIGARALSAAANRESPLWALGMPVSVMLMTVVAGQALWWHWNGGPVWKGRVLRPGVNR